MADEELEFVEEETSTTKNSKPVEAESSEGKKYITATLGVDTDSELIQSYDLLRSVGGFDNRAIVEAGIGALFVSDEFKARAQKLKDILK